MMIFLILRRTIYKMTMKDKSMIKIEVLRKKLRKYFKRRQQIKSLLKKEMCNLFLILQSRQVLIMIFRKKRNYKMI